MTKFDALYKKIINEDSHDLEYSRRVITPEVTEYV